MILHFNFLYKLYAINIYRQIKVPVVRLFMLLIPFILADYLKFFKKGDPCKILWLIVLAFNMVENCLETAVMDLENGFRKHLFPAIINGAFVGFLWILVGTRYDVNIFFFSYTQPITIQEISLFNFFGGIYYSIGFVIAFAL